MPVAWTASFVEDLDAATIPGGLPASTEDPQPVIDCLHRFGFAIVDGTEVAAPSDIEAFARALGTPVPQSPRAEMIEDVRDMSDRETDDRGYRSGGELGPHTDPPTLLLLHAVTPARSGGASRIVSVAAIVERLAAEAPERAAVLFEEFPRWQVAGQHGRAAAGPDPQPAPVLARHDGVVTCLLYRPFVELAAEATGRPLTAEQVAALDAFERWSHAPELTLEFQLTPGQTLVLHNRTVLHARTDYVDWPELDRRRHLRRMWIDSPDRFPAAPSHALGDLFSPV